MDNRSSFFAAVLMMLTFVESAQAYIDPGAGSLLFQGLIGGIAAGLALATAYWKRLKLVFLSRGSTRSKAEDD